VRHPLGPRPAVLSDRLLVTVIHHRWKTQHQALTRLLGAPRGAVSDAIHEMTAVLESLDRRIRPAPITAPTVQDLTNLIDKSNSNA
jgi:hypothetical protein